VVVIVVMVFFGNSNNGVSTEKKNDGMSWATTIGTSFIAQIITTK
jgi:hypothetical protein